MGTDSGVRGDDDAGSEVITAVVIDDHEVVTEGIRSWCAHASPPITVLGTTDRVSGAWVGPGADADVVVLDLQLGGGTQVELVELRRLVQAGRRIVVYTQDNDRSTAVRCIDHGVLAYVTKSEGRAHLVAAMHAAARGEPYTPPSLSGALLADRDPRRPALARMEIESLRRWFGSSSKKIAAESLNISAKTLDTYITRVRIKYANVGRSGPSKSELVARALEDGIITLTELGGTTPAAGEPGDRPTR